MKTRRSILTATVAMSLLVVAAAHAEWTDQDTRDCWDWAKTSATRIVTTPRYSGADEEAGEGMLEAFGTEYMPNAYGIYQKARATAKERELALKESFPKGIQSDSTGGITYRKIAKATAKAICEMDRRHDELCHFYLLHKAGVMTQADLADKDQTVILMMLPIEVEMFAKDDISVNQPSDAERSFASKYLPDVLASYDRLCALLTEGRASFAELKKDAVCLDAIRTLDLQVIFLNRLRSLVFELNKTVDIMKQNKLLYDVEEVSAEDLAKLNQETALKLQASEKKYAVRDYVQKKVDEFWANDEYWAWQLPPAKQIVRQLVSIPGRNFKIGKYEVTQAQWQGIMGENPSEFKGDFWDAFCPVESVSWIDCQTFLEKLNAQDEVKQLGLVFRLPSKEEWTYACRAGAKGEYCLLADGTEITEETLDKVAWHEKNAGSRPKIVGHKKPNAFKLYDMLGNVAEWTSTSDSRNDKFYFVMGRSYNDFVINFDEDEFKKTTWEGRNTGLRVVAESLEDRQERVRTSGIDSNARIAAVRPKLEGMGIVTKIVELPGDTQLLMNELPNRGHFMGAFEVTQAQWESIMGNNPCEVKGGDLPVERVAWTDCKMYIEKLNELDEIKKSGLVFHLPTEKEWEYACYADADRRMEIKSYDVAWTRDNSDNQTHPVGQKKPNAFGLYDVFGNVREWMEDETDQESHRVLGYGYADKVSPFWYATSLPASSRQSNSGLRKDIGFRLAADNPNVIEETAAAKAAEKAAEEADRIATLNTSISAVMPTLKKMNIETAIIELTEGAQLLMNKLPDGKWIGAFEVTTTQWKSVMGKRASEIENSDFPMTFNNDYDLGRLHVDFLKKLNSLEAVKQSGLIFSLPTKEEWEYACHAGAKGKFCRLADGTEVTKKTLVDVAWYCDDWPFPELHPVGRKKPNAFGLYDMFGNTWELTSVDPDRPNRLYFSGGSHKSSIEVISGAEVDECPASPYGFRLAARKEAAQ